MKRLEIKGPFTVGHSNMFVVGGEVDMEETPIMYLTGSHEDEGRVKSVVRDSALFHDAIAIWVPRHADNEGLPTSLQWGFSAFEIDGRLVAWQRVLYMKTFVDETIEMHNGTFVVISSPLNKVSAYDGRTTKDTEGTVEIPIGAVFMPDPDKIN